MFWKFGNLEITWNLCRRVGLETKDNPATRSLGLITDRPMEPESPPAERALRIAPVRSKEPPAARELGLRAQCKSPEG